MDDLKKSIQELANIFNTRMSDFEKKQVPNPDTVTTSSLATEFSMFKRFITGALSSLQQQLALLTREVDSLDMHRRRKMLLFHGVPENPNEDVEISLEEVIRSKLKLTDVSAKYFSKCHRMGKDKDTKDKPRPILVKFSDMYTRAEVWAAKTALKGSGITMSEFLTKARHDLFMKARQRLGVSKCWTREGTIFVMDADDVRHRVTSAPELDAISPSKEDDSERKKPKPQDKRRRPKK